MMGFKLFFKHMMFIQGYNVKMDEMLKKLILGLNEYNVTKIELVGDLYFLFQREMLLYICWQQHSSRLSAIFLHKMKLKVKRVFKSQSFSNKNESNKLVSCIFAY